MAIRCSILHHRHHQSTESPKQNKNDLDSLIFFLLVLPLIFCYFFLGSLTHALCFFQKEHHHNLFSIHDETQKVEYNIFVHMKKNNDKAALSHQWRTTKNTHNPPLYNPWEREAEEKCKRTPSRWSVGCLLILLLGQYKRKGFAYFTTTTTTTRTTTSP